MLMLCYEHEVCDGGMGTDFSAAHNEDFLVLDLPGEDEGAAALHFGELGGHGHGWWWMEETGDEMEI